MNLVLMIIQNRGSDNAWKKFLLSLSHFDVLVKHAQDQTLDGTSITLFKIRELVKEAIKFECQMTKQSRNISYISSRASPRKYV